MPTDGAGGSGPTGDESPALGQQRAEELGAPVPEIDQEFQAELEDYLSGREDKNKERRGVLNPKPFIEGGVNMCFSTNNIQNGFTPFGRGDLLLIGAIYEHAAQLGTVDDQYMLLDMITRNAAKILGIERTYGLEEGKSADLVVIGTKKVSDLFIKIPSRRLVIKKGRIIYRSEPVELKGWWS